MCIWSDRYLRDLKFKKAEVCSRRSAFSSKLLFQECMVPYLARPWTELAGVFFLVFEKTRLGDSSLCLSTRSCMYNVWCVTSAAVTVSLPYLILHPTCVIISDSRHPELRNWIWSWLFVKCPCLKYGSMGQLARDPSSLEENTENCKRPSVGVFRTICDISNKSTGKSTLQFKTPLGMIFHCSFFQKDTVENFSARVHLPSGHQAFFFWAPSCYSFEVACHWAPNTPSTRISQRFLPLHSTLDPTKNQGGWLEMRVMGWLDFGDGGPHWS